LIFAIGWAVCGRPQPEMSQWCHCSYFYAKCCV